MKFQKIITVSWLILSLTTICFSNDKENDNLDESVNNNDDDDVNNSEGNWNLEEIIILNYL